MHKIFISLLGLSTGMLTILILLFGNFYFGVAIPDIFYPVIEEEKLDERLQISQEELKNVADCMVEYVKDWQPSERLSIYVTINGEKNRFFTESEKVHLEDVRKILTGMSRTTIWCMIVWIFLTGFFLFTNNIQAFFRGYIMATICFLTASIAIGIWVAFDIKRFIMLFHQILIPNNLWIMNPLKEKVVYFFPDSLYRMALVRFITLSLTEFIILTMIILVRNRRGKKL